MDIKTKQATTNLLYALVSKIQFNLALLSISHVYNRMCYLQFIEQHNRMCYLQFITACVICFIKIGKQYYFFKIVILCMFAIL